MAAFPGPRRTLNPAFRKIVRASDHPGWQIAEAVGIRHYPKFSALINAKSVPATPITIDRLYRIADAIGFDRGALFLDGGGR